MLTREGLSEALQGVDVIVHAATDSCNLGQTGVEMTRRLLEKAKAAQVCFFVYNSIVGIDKTSFTCSLAKRQNPSDCPKIMP